MELKTMGGTLIFPKSKTDCKQDVRPRADSGHTTWTQQGVIECLFT